MDRVFLDACVLYPTLLREVLLRAAGQGLFTPLWSPRVLEEWRRAALRQGSDASGEILLLHAQFPDASHAPGAGLEEALSLPDADDVHVLAAALSAGAEALLTFNTKDFPTRTLGRHGLIRLHPDPFLLSLHTEHPEAMERIIQDAQRHAETAYGRPLDLRALLKRAGLPRLGKALAR